MIDTSAALPQLSESETASAVAEAETGVLEPIAFSAAPITWVQQTVRSGQVIKATGNLVILGDVHAGAEVIAAGDILIWGHLWGLAQAGADIENSGENARCEIRALGINALQLRIGSFIARQPDKAWQHKLTGPEQQLLPEVARVTEGEIRIYQDII